MPEAPDNSVVIPDVLEGPHLPHPEAVEDEESANGTCPVVGIGASAGGLEAFSQLLRDLPQNTGMAFVLVQHLDPHHESILAEILASHTKMPVNQASQSTRVEPDRVFVIPPNTLMRIRKGVLELTQRSEDRARPLPIDYFLCSLAEDQKSRAIGVILSGSASDGTLGLKAIKSVGGITFAQDASARFDSMPRSAVAAGVVDFILPPGTIAHELADIAHHSYMGMDEPASTVEEPVLQKILSLLRTNKTVDFTHYKRPTLKRRLARRMALHHTDDATSYLALLERDASEINALFDDMLINVTEFFRESGAFKGLAKVAFPAILKDRKADEPVRIWVPGCSTGEEVYSIAICLTEYLEQTNQSFPIQMFGTDVSERAIETARAGRYAESIHSVVSPERLKRFFLRLEPSGYQIARPIRELCVFSRHDLTKDPPLSRMDLISCRNLLIYLGPILQRRVMATFSYALQPSGCLVLGHSETPGSLAEHFVALDRDYKIYTRNLRLAQPGLDFGNARVPEPSAAPSPQLKKQDAIVLLDRETDRMMAEHYGPSGLMVDADRQVIKFRGNVGPYIAPPTGTATLDVLRLVREDLALSLREALDEAARRNAAVRKERVQIRRNDRLQEIDIVVRPILKLGAERYYLVLFEEIFQQGNQDAQGGNHAGLSSGDRDLAEELASTRAYLQSLIEELRTANEEAQSANEELQSTNEELQTAKEELQSSNEELTTTNDEMKSRNRELSEANNDLLNLLSSMRVPIVMLNKELRIRRFTPLAEKTLNLISTDVGRPISDLKPRINVPDLEHLLAKVIYSLTALEQEVQDQEGRWYSMRINPYRTSDDRIDGAVLQLLDIDQMKHTVEAAEHARRYSEAIFETVREPLVVLDNKLRVRTANRSFFETFRVTDDETITHSIFGLSNGQWDTPKVRKLLADIVSGETLLQDVEIEADIARGAGRLFQLNARLLKKDGDGGQILLALEDVTDRKRAAEAKYRRLFESAKDGILIIAADSGEITDVNPFVIELFGFSRAELMGKPFWEVAPLSGIPELRGALDRLRAQEMVRFADVPVRTKDGQLLEVEAIGNIYSEGEKRVIQFNIRDITERKQFDRQLQQTAKLESLGLLAGGVAHDFNNLLTGIMGNASLVLDNAPPESPDRKQLREIVKTTQRAADLTRQMLAYSGRGRFVVKLIDFSELVQEISSLVRSSIPKTIDVRLNLAENLPAVEADATQIQQLVMNLVINGAEAVGEGKPGVVRVATGQEQLDRESIRVNYPAEDLKPGIYVVLEVQDSGSGMDEATKAKIFDPFFTTKFTGRGLGLAAALGIVRGHGGAIRVDSAPGKGTTFKVLFPAAASGPVPRQVEESPEDLHGTGLVLVVDDEEMVRQMARPALERYGYQVLTAPHGEAAVEIVRERGDELALIILDLTMPVMGGEEAVAKIKAIRPEIPVILSSGYDEMQSVQRFGERDLAGFIQKPYSVQELLQVVKTTLG